jgi:hypothetical protein
MKRMLRILMVLTLIVSILAGCSTVTGDDPIKYPLVPALSEKEVVDYYKKSLEFDSLVSRKSDNLTQVYELKPVDEAKQNELKNVISRIEAILGKMQYKNSEEAKELVSESLFHYIKAYLNDKQLVNGNVINIGTIMGYYMVDVEYEVKARSIGTFKPQVSLLGIHGAFVKNYDGTDTIDILFIKQLVKDVNKYYKDNGINNEIYFDEANKSLRSSNNNIIEAFVENESVESNENIQVQEPVNTGEVNTEGTQNTDGAEGNENVAGTENIEGNQTAEGQEDIQLQEIEQNAVVDNPVNNSKDIGNRGAFVNTLEINRIGGSSKSESAYMPKLEMVYNIPNAEGTISGIGIFPSGGNGLRALGLDREKLKGRIQLRYVIKQAIENPSKFACINIYPMYYEIETGIGSNTTEILVPEFLEGELKKIIERADRAIINNDLSALMSGMIYSDIGMAVLNGYIHQFTNLQRQISVLRRVIIRDTQNRRYLLEVETLRQEGAKGTGTYGTFMDRNYVVVEQVGSSFIITDAICINRRVTQEPYLNPDSAVLKKIVALNLVGEIPEESKEQIRELINALYMAGTCRILRGPKEVVYNGQKITLEKGMYDCFNSDTSVLPEDKLEYLNSSLRDLLIKEGIDTPATHMGTVVEWIGGNDIQAEFVTEELIRYEGRNKGYYMQVYYLVSNTEGEWVIDEMKVIEGEMKEGAEVEEIASRLQS